MGWPCRRSRRLPPASLKSLRLTSSLCAIFLCVVSAGASELFLGPIPVQFVAAGSNLLVDLHRFYQPTSSSKFEIIGAESVQLSYDRSKLQLQIRVESSARGLIDLPFTIRDGRENKEGIITLAVRSPGRHEFIYRPTGKPLHVAVAGSFNGWNRDASAMKDEKDGTFRTSLALAPGSYSYKFFADGEWVVDSDNPRREPDGFGGTNSLLTIEQTEESGGLYIYADKREKDGFTIKASGRGEIRSASVVVELPDGSSKTVKAEARPSTISISNPAVPAGSWLRVVAADGAGRSSNVIRFSLGEAEDFRWQDAIMYYALTDRFFDGDKTNDQPVKNPRVKPPANFHGGDWRGVEEKIKEGYFKELGVNTIWIAPLNRNPSIAYQEYPEPHRWYTGYHGYWPVSPTEVEPHFGDAAALKSLVKTAHASGLEVVADLVLHHVHAEHPWWKQHRDWFGTLELPDGTKNLRRWDDYQFTTWFEPYMPTFNFANADAVAALIDNSAWWANQYDLDGFRLDAVKHIPTDFWWKFRSALRTKIKSGRHLYLVGETFRDRTGIDSYVGPNMLDGQFDFPLYDSIKESLAEESAGLDSLEASLEASEDAYGKESLMSPLIGNHDKGRFMAYADNDLPDPKGTKEEEVGWVAPPTVNDPANYARIELAQAFLLAIDGVPMIYYGDEIGMTGAGDPDNRRDMRFGDDVTVAEKSVRNNFEKLTRIRRDHAALRKGSRRPIGVEKNFLAFVRAHFEDRVLCLFNRSSQPAERDLAVGPELADGDYINLLDGTRASVRDGKMQVRVGSHRAAFFVSVEAKD
jgi:cyclomaltodextrinase